MTETNKQTNPCKAESSCENTENQNWFKVSRSLFNHEIWRHRNKNIRVVWIYLIGNCHWHDGEVVVGGRRVQVSRGCWVGTYGKLSKACGISKDQLYRALNHLKDMECVTATLPATAGIRLCICNYSRYQSTGVTGRDATRDENENIPYIYIYKNKRKKTELRSAASPSSKSYPRYYFEICKQVRELILLRNPNHPLSANKYFQGEIWRWNWLQALNKASVNDQTFRRISAAIEIAGKQYQERGDSFWVDRIYDCTRLLRHYEALLRQVGWVDREAEEEKAQAAIDNDPMYRQFIEQQKREWEEEHGRPWDPEYAEALERSAAVNA